MQQKALSLMQFQKKFDTFPNIIIPKVYPFFTEYNNNSIVMEFIDENLLIF